ncbi:MAG: tetraacyldisaccharide 4'-kinase [Bacteroidia bacterium]|nr:tetraacyldisaccharide 4'-kinase [Bacteroidia bacterium]
MIRIVLLSPIAAIYWLVTSIRNWCYDRQLFKSTSFEIPIISVGNLSVGGTGKTPMVEYLINLLSKKYTIAVLSRGYGRKTSGFLWVEKTRTAKEVGDEPLQIKCQCNQISVAVCENRVHGVQQILKEKPETSLIILDDAFQHRRIQPKVSLLLSTYEKPYFKDWMLPAGNLRERRNSANRSDAIIMTKCPENFEKINQKSKPVFYAQSKYTNPGINTPVFGFSGLANNAIFKKHLTQNYNLIGFQGFKDHNVYSQDQLDALAKKANGATLLCTEKDWVKIKNINTNHPIKKVGIAHQITEKNKFNNWLIQKIES